MPIPSRQAAKRIRRSVRFTEDQRLNLRGPSIGPTFRGRHFPRNVQIFEFDAYNNPQTWPIPVESKGRLIVWAIGAGGGGGQGAAEHKDDIGGTGGSGGGSGACAMAVVRGRAGKDLTITIGEGGSKSTGSGATAGTATKVQAASTSDLDLQAAGGKAGSDGANTQQTYGGEGGVGAAPSTTGNWVQRKVTFPGSSGDHGTRGTGSSSGPTAVGGAPGAGGRSFLGGGLSPLTFSAAVHTGWGGEGGYGFGIATGGSGFDGGDGIVVIMW